MNNAIDWPRVNSISHDKEIFNAWCKEIEKTGKIEYYHTNILVLEHLNKPLLSITKGELKKYFDESRNSNKTKNKKISALRHFFQYAKANSMYSGLDLSIFPPRYSQVESEDQNVGKPLSLNEFIDLRNMLMQKKSNQKWAIMLELFYVYGFKIDDLKSFTSDTYDYKIGCFIKGGKKYKLSDRLIKLLIENPQYVDQISTQNVHSAFGRMSEKFERNVKWTDINEMYKMGMCCPMCGEKLGNDLDYWIVACRPDDSFSNNWLICCNCYERIKHNGEV